MKHTPGPWRINTRLSRNGAPVISGDGRDIAKALYHMGSEDPEVDANARLIAAAPELLAALETALAWLNTFDANGLMKIGGVELKITVAEAIANAISE